MIYYDRRIRKWRKNSEQKSEYEFWKHVYQKKWDKKWFQGGIIVPKITILSRKPFQFQMEMEDGGMPLLECFPSHKYESFLSSFHEIYQLLEDYNIVHGDIHFKNILYQKSLSQCRLIDFGISSYSVHMNPLHECYRWSREDLYRFYLLLWQWKVIQLKIEDIPQVDFSHERSLWKQYFNKYPFKWKSFQTRFYQWFLWEKKTPKRYRKLYLEFMKNILSAKSYLIENEQSQDKFIVKLLLERFSLFFQMWELPPKSIQNATLYQSLLLRCWNHREKNKKGK